MQMQRLAKVEAERDALLSRVRALEVDLAEAEAEPVGGEAEDRDALASAREKIEGLSALAARRGDALLQAEAAAASAAAEVASLKKQLETAAAAAAVAASATAAIRALETDMASMLTEEESAARVRELELAMAEMVDAEEMDALLVHVRAVEARAQHVHCSVELCSSAGWEAWLARTGGTSADPADEAFQMLSIAAGS